MVVLLLNHLGERDETSWHRVHAIAQSRRFWTSEHVPSALAAPARDGGAKLAEAPVVLDIVAVSGCQNLASPFPIRTRPMKRRGAAADAAIRPSVIVPIAAAERRSSPRAASRQTSRTSVAASIRPGFPTLATRTFSLARPDPRTRHRHCLGEAARFRALRRGFGALHAHPAKATVVVARNDRRVNP